MDIRCARREAMLIMWSCDFPFFDIQNYHENLGIFVLKYQWKIIEFYQGLFVGNPDFYVCLSVDYSWYSTRITTTQYAPNFLVNYKLPNYLKLLKFFRFQLTFMIRYPQDMLQYVWSQIMFFLYRWYCFVVSNLIMLWFYRYVIHIKFQ